MDGDNLQEVMGKLTPDGYRMTDMPLDLVIKTAFVPQVGGAAFYSPGQVKGYPDWVPEAHHGRVLEVDPQKGRSVGPRASNAVAGIVGGAVGIAIAGVRRAVPVIILIERTAHLNDGSPQLHMGQCRSQRRRHHGRDFVVPLHAGALTVERVVIAIQRMVIARPP